MMLSVIFIYLVKFVSAAGIIWLRRKEREAVNVIALYLLAHAFSTLSGDGPTNPEWLLRCMGRELLTVAGLLWFCGNFRMRNWLIYVLLGCAAVNLSAYFDFVLGYFWWKPRYAYVIQAAAIFELLILCFARAYETEQERATKRRKLHERAFRRRFSALYSPRD